MDAFSFRFELGQLKLKFLRIWIRTRWAVEERRRHFWKWREIKIAHARKKSVLLPMLLGCTYERELYFAIERTRFVKNRAVRAKEALDENTLQHNFWYALFIAPSPDIPRWVKSMLDYFLEKWMLFKDSLNRFAHDRSHVTRVFSLFHSCNETCMYIYICIGHIIGDQFIGQYVIMRNKI